MGGGRFEVAGRGVEPPAGRVGRGGAGSACLRSAGWHWAGRGWVGWRSVGRGWVGRRSVGRRWAGLVLCGVTFDGATLGGVALD
ncbi:hypothetical protein LV78_002449 [Actinosynnema pretiosum]|nr:hypothetical protein [Actinosynnema pretiosum]